MSATKMIKKSAKQIADANQYGWGSLVLMEIIERGIADLRNDPSPCGFDAKTQGVKDVFEILEANGITDASDPMFGEKPSTCRKLMVDDKSIKLSGNMIEVDIDDNIDQRRF